MRFKLLEEYYNSTEYREKVKQRFSTYKLCEDEPLEITRLVLERWSVDPIQFIEQFGWVIIPEFNNEVKPFFLFDYQKRVIQKIWEAELSGEDHEILIDKPRGMGLTWAIVWYQIWRWLFTQNWGGFNLSRTEDEVDQGNADPNSSIFGKYRWSLGMLPQWMIPESFVPKGKKGTSTDMQLRIANPSLGSTLIGSTTNQNAGRSRRYSFTFIDECFAIEHFNAVYRALQSVSRVKVFVSTVKAGKVFQDFKTMCEARDNYISLKWTDHPFKDEQWYKEQLIKAEFDPEVMKEIEVDYAVNIRSQYYPEIRQAQIVYGYVYDRKRPMYISIDFGAQDLTVIIWWLFDGNNFVAFACFSNSRKSLEWYLPFLNPEIQENPDHYLPQHLEFLKKARTWGRAKAVFGEAAHFQKVMPLNRSIADELYTKGRIRLIYNNYAINYQPRRKATSLLLPRTIFNFDDDGITELYDALSNSRYAESNKGTSKESHLKPVHDTGIADFRSAAENFYVNVPRILRLQRGEVPLETKRDSSIRSLIQYLKI